MRQILIGDIIAAARSLLEVPPQEWAQAATTMLDHAHIADKVAKRTGLPHREWGNGSLMAAAFPTPKGTEPFLNNPAYIAAMHLVLQQLIAWRQANRRSIRCQGAGKD